MEVNLSYIEFLLKLLNSEQNININEYQEELIVNLYLTLLSLSNNEHSESIERKNKEIIDDFLRKLNNIKVKIQLKRKSEEINKLSEDLITQYYENINILSTYISDGTELENVIHTMDAKKITTLIDQVTKDKMDKEDRKEEIEDFRKKITKLLPTSNYYIEKDDIYIYNNEEYEKISLKQFVEAFSYLLNPDNYSKLYADNANQINRELIIANIIKLIIIKDKKIEELNKILIPLILNYILSLNIDNIENINTSDFVIENIKITELYSLAANKKEYETDKTIRWRNISIPNSYLISKLNEMIKKGMYYYKDEQFVLEKIEGNTSDFRISIQTEKVKELLKNILETQLELNNIKKK